MTNLVQLIGLGIAVDYSLLIVYRFREELAAGRAEDEAVVRTMETAGRAVVFSGFAVALGLALLVAMPLPFMRMLGIAGFLIPIVSIAARGDAPAGAALALRPSRHRRRRILPGAPTDPERGFWARLARSIMARPVVYLVSGRRPAARGGGAGVLPAADAGLDLRDPAQAPVDPGLRRCSSTRSGRERSRRRRCSSRRAPGRCSRPETQAAIGRLVAGLRRDPEVARGLLGAGGPLRRRLPALRAGDRRRPPRLRLPGVAVLRAAAALDADPGSAVPGGRRTCASAAGRRRASTSSTRPTATSCRSSSRCCSSPTCC